MSRASLPVDRLAVISRLTGEYGQPLTILPWWTDAFRALDDPQIRELIVWLVRQDGKSQAEAAMAISELLTRPGSYTVLISASETQAQAIFTRKIRKPLERLLKSLGLPASLVHFTQRSVEIPSMGSALEVIATNEATAPGRAPTLLLFDECRDIPDEVFAALVPSVIGAGGTIVMASTAGQPSGFFYEATQNPTPETWMVHGTENTNPHAHQGVLAFLKRRLGIFAPAAVRRELQNEFTTDGESFLPPALIEDAIDDRLGELPSSPLPAFGFLDLSRKHDLTSLVVVVRDQPRRPETKDHLVAASVQVWDPRRSPTGETNFAEVRAALDALLRRFPKLERILVDEGAEAGSVLPFAKAHPGLTMIIKGFIATAESNIALWGALAARLHAGTLAIPRHERLIAELRGLRQESFAFGSKWRVVDSSRKFHRDVSLALAGACFAAGEVADRKTLGLWDSDMGMFTNDERYDGIRTDATARQQHVDAAEADAKQESNREILEQIKKTGVWLPGDR